MSNLKNFDHENEDFDGYCEEDFDLIQNKDYEGLVKLREHYFKENPDDIYVQLRLGEAYSMNKEYDKALECLEKLHAKEPNFIDAQHVVLDVLFEQGKDVDDFNWVRKPSVVNLKTAVIIVDEMLRNNRKYRPLWELYIDLMTSGYLNFTEEMLLAVLTADDRFDIKGDELFWHECAVKLKGQKKR